MVRIKVTEPLTRPAMLPPERISPSLTDGLSLIDGVPAPPSVSNGSSPSAPNDKVIGIDSKEFILTIIEPLSDRAHYLDAIDQYGNKWRKCSYGCARTNTWKLLNSNNFYARSGDFHPMCIECFKDYDKNRKRSHSPSVQKGAKKPRLTPDKTAEIIKIETKDNKMVTLTLEPQKAKAKYRDAIDSEGNYWRRCGLKCTEQNVWKLRDINSFCKSINSDGFEGRCRECLRTQSKKDSDTDMEDISDKPDKPDAQEDKGGDYLENGIWMRPCRLINCKSQNIRKELNLVNFPAKEKTANNKGFDYRCRSCMKALQKQHREKRKENRSEVTDAAHADIPASTPPPPLITAPLVIVVPPVPAVLPFQQEQKISNITVDVLKKIESRFADLEQQQKTRTQALEEEVRKLNMLKTTMHYMDQMVNKQKEMDVTNKQLQEIRSQTIDMEKQLQDKLHMFQ